MTKVRAVSLEEAAVGALLGLVGGIEGLPRHGFDQAIALEDGSPLGAEVRLALHDGSVCRDEEAVIGRDELQAGAGTEALLEHLLQRGVGVGLGGGEGFRKVAVEPVVDRQRSGEAGTIDSGLEGQ
jgi:hypothetical protein